MRIAACIVIASALTLLDASLLRAQCDGIVPHDFCQDSCCQTDALLLNTGYDHIGHGLYDAGRLDEFWTIVADEGTGRAVPRYANVIEPADDWKPAFRNSGWIGGTGVPLDPVSVRTTYQKCFCTCGPDSTDLTFTMSIQTDNHAVVSLDNVAIANVPPNTLTFTRRVGPGRHCLEVELTNPNVDVQHWGLNVQGTIQGLGLLKYNCCAAAPIVNDNCDTSRLTIGTDNTWTLVSEPATGPGPTPRCADIVTIPAMGWGWATPATGSSWIGANANGTSAPAMNIPPAPAPNPNLYVYRKTFCVAQPGTFIISVTGSADDYGVVELNGVPLTPGGSFFDFRYLSTHTYTVALGAGCNCIEIKVLDLFFSKHGVDALIDIQGGHLLKPECCTCPSCNDIPPQRPGRHEEPGDAVLGIHAPDAEARPMLLSMPNPATGETTVHYTLDKEADAHVELYNAAGQRVLVVDEGVRAKGAHAVPLATSGLAKGAYHLRLVYGSHTLTVPVTVQ